jgi:hypothetical protein
MNFDKQLCQLLKTNYNTYKVDGVKDEDFIKELCRYIITQRHSINLFLINQSNFTLIKLLFNKYFREIPHLDNIVGPCSLSLHKSEKYNKTVYVFGEHHCDNISIDSKCPPNANYLTISQVLNRCAMNSPVFLDIFVEFPKAVQWTGSGPTGMIGDIMNVDNKECWLDSKVKSHQLSEACATTRWHFTDVRFTKEYSQTSIAGHVYYDLRSVLYTLRDSRTIEWNKLDLVKLIKISQNNDNLRKIKEKRPPSFDIPNYLSGITIDGLPQLLQSMKIKNIKNYEYKILVYVLYVFFSKEMLEFYQLCARDDIKGLKKWFYDQFMYSDKELLLKKEIDRSYKSETISNFLNKKIEIDINSHRKSISNISKSMLSTIQPSSMPKKYKSINLMQFIFEYSSPITELISDVGCLFTDSYTLARIFKRFNIQKIHDMPETPSNIITYAGDIHARNLRDFFENYIDDFVTIAQKNNISCPKQGDYSFIDYPCCLNVENFPQPFFNKDISS